MRRILFSIGSFLLLVLLPNWTVLATVTILGPDNSTVDTFYESAATLGHIPSSGILGVVAVPNYPDGCKPVAGPPIAVNGSFKWIALLEYDGCLIDIKVRNIRMAGFDAAIIGHDPPPRPIHSSSPSADDSSTTNTGNGSLLSDAGDNTPCAFIPIIEAAKIKKLYAYDTGYTVRITPYFFNYWFEIFGIVILSVLGILLLCGGCLLLCKALAPRLKAIRSPATRSLAQFRILQFGADDNSGTCTICQEDFRLGDKLLFLFCSHAFHEKCMRRWLRESSVQRCPLCQADIKGSGQIQHAYSIHDDASERSPLLADASGGPSQSTVSRLPPLALGKKTGKKQNIST